MLVLMDTLDTVAAIYNYYKHYKYYHFYAVCFGLSVGLVCFRPRVSMVMVLTMVVFFTLVFEVMGLVIDVIMGFAVAGFVAVLHNNVYYVCTLSYGMGIMTFAILGTIRKYRSLCCNASRVKTE